MHRQNFRTLRDFCEQLELSLSRHGHSVMSENQFYQVFMFAIEEHAEIFHKEFGGGPSSPRSWQASMTESSARSRLMRSVQDSR